MDHLEAKGKLERYAEMYGTWIYDMSPKAMRIQAASFKESDRSDQSVLERHLLLVKSVHFDCIAECLELIGPASGNVSNIRTATSQSNKNVAEIEDPEEKSPQLEDFKFSELKTQSVEPRFKVGDLAWINCFDDSGEIEGYLPIVVVGYELYPDEIYYMIGHCDELTGIVSTNYETVEDCDIFHEIPDSPNSRKILKKERHLRIVK